METMKCKNDVFDQSMFLYPKYISEAWIERFMVLEFTIDSEGYLYSPKSYNEAWDDQTKALWLRSVGMAPLKIADKLNVDGDKLKISYIDKITKHYKLRSVGRYDWATVGRTNAHKQQYINYGGSPDITVKQQASPYHLQDEAQMMMDTALNDVRRVVRAADRPK